MYLCVALQFPLEAQYSAMRQEALAPLRSLLLDASEAFKVNGEFAASALERLTAEECAILCDWTAVASARRTPNNAWFALCIINQLSDLYSYLIGDWAAVTSARCTPSNAWYAIQYFLSCIVQSYSCIVVRRAAGATARRTSPGALSSCGCLKSTAALARRFDSIKSL